MTNQFNSSDPEQRPSLSIKATRELLMRAGDIALGNNESKSEAVRAHIGEYFSGLFSKVDVIEGDGVRLADLLYEDEAPTVRLDNLMSDITARKNALYAEHGMAADTAANRFRVVNDELLAIHAVELYVGAASNEPHTYY